MSVAPLDRPRSEFETPFSAPARGRLRRVLIISPHFPPINAADHHRVRLALSHFHEHGWVAEILAVDPDDVEGVLDPDLARALPPDIKVHWTAAWSTRWTRPLGWGSLARRAYRQLRNRGDALLAEGCFDLIFFSTTQFGVLPLGPDWKRRFGVPYVLEFQDEWVSSYYAERPEIRPPGGRMKYAASRWLAQRQEPEVIMQAARIVSVSATYLDHLIERYPQLPRLRLDVLPFGGDPQDFEQLARLPSRPHFFDPADGRMHWVYVGRGGSDMQRAMGAFFSALRRAFATQLLTPEEVRIHFIGTSYAPAKLAQKTFQPLADQYGLGEIVSEHTARVPYFVALQCLRQAHALVIPGSEDEGYTASKIFPALLAERPLLAIFRAESSAVTVLRATGAGTVVTFTSRDSEIEISNRIFETWFARRAFAQTSQWDRTTFEPYSAASMTRRLSAIFDTALAYTASAS